MEKSTSMYQQDKLYREVLSFVKDGHCSQDILAFLCFSDAALLVGGDFRMLGEILGHDTETIKATLNDLSHVTILPTFCEEDEAAEDIKRTLPILLPDFQNYLLDKRRSKDLYIDPQRAYVQLTRTLLPHLPSYLSSLQEAICPTTLIVSGLFITICTKITHPTKDLWTDLLELDLDTYFILLHHSSCMQGGDLFDQASKLLTWVRKHDHYALNVLGFKRSLYLQYRESWDRKVGSCLRRLSVDRQASNIITVLQHPQYLTAGPEFFFHASQILCDSSIWKQATQFEYVITVNGICLPGGQSSQKSTFLPMLLEYLNDFSRSGEVWSTRDVFLSAAEAITKFLFTHIVPLDLKVLEEEKSHPSYSSKDKTMPTANPETFLHALRLLPGYLDGASYDPKLVEYLDSNTLPISPMLPEKVDFDLAVLRYKSKKNLKVTHLIPSPDDNEVKFDEEDAVWTTETTSTEDYRYSFASSSTGLSTGDYGFYWTRRAFSQETVNTITST